jgi:hypothetical protein
MTRTIRLVTAALVLAMAAPASAQVKVRDHRKGKKAPKIKATGFSPDRGAVGTQVTITGSGFNPDTEVLIGGREVRADEVRPKSITFTIPAKHGDGYIVLRHPNVARDIDVGTFSVLIDMSISRFSPTKGTPGTRVEIRGDGFESGDDVLMNGKAVKINKLRATKIIVTIPSNATTGYLVVARGHDQVSTAKKFKVLTPAPIIDRISPESAAAGTDVIIKGRNFGPDDTPYYGKKPMKVISRGTDYIEARIPAKARKNRYIWVTGVSGEAQSAAKFTLEKPPEITRITPTYGQVGDRIEIYGTNFRAGDKVSLNGRSIKIIQLRAKQISVRMPRNAKSGAFVVERGSTQVVADQIFDVVYEPVITDFSPTGGEAGTKVVITGRHFSKDVDVYYGAAKLRGVKRKSDTKLVVKIPKRATDQAFTIETRGGEATSRSTFVVHSYPTVSKIKPKQGFAGTRITIRGTNLRDVDAAYLGPVALRIVDRKAKYIVVEVPPKANSAVLYIERYNEMFKTKYTFKVLEEPVVKRFTPATGEPGTRITVHGENFTRKTEVFFGNQEMDIVKRNLPGSVVVELPAKASGDRYIWVKEGSAEVRSKDRFTAIAAPAITGFSPRQGKPGTLVTITGHDFTKTTEVQLGAIGAKVVKRKGSSTIVIEVPEGNKKTKPYLWITQGAASARAQRTFKILPSASLKKLSSHNLEVGAQLIVHGKNLDTETRVYFGNAELTVVKVGGKGRRLWVDANITGKDYIVIDDRGVRSRSKKKLTVTPPPPPPKDAPPPKVKVRDHRKNK